MASITIQIDAAAGKVKLDRLLEAVEPETVLRVIGARLLSYVDESFRTRGRGTWRALAALTLQLRRHGGDMPLQDTGRLKQSYVSETDSRTFIEVGSNLKTSDGVTSLSKIHEFGTGPYTIRIRRAKVLAAQTRVGSWIFFGKEVHHPGITARPVLPTKAVAEQMILETIDGMLNRVTAPDAARFGGDGIT